MWVIRFFIIGLPFEKNSREDSRWNHILEEYHAAHAYAVQERNYIIFINDEIRKSKDWLI